MDFAIRLRFASHFMVLHRFEMWAIFPKRLKKGRLRVCIIHENTQPWIAICDCSSCFSCNGLTSEKSPVQCKSALAVMPISLANFQGEAEELWD